MDVPETPHRVTQKALAAALGVTSAALTKARGIGRIVRGEDGLYDLAESVESFRGSRAQSPPGPDHGVTSPAVRDVRQATARRVVSTSSARVVEPTTLLDFKTLQTEEQWLEARLKRQQKQGELVERNIVDAEWQSIGVRVRDAMLQIPYSIAQELAAETDPRVVRDSLRVAIEQALTRLCDAMAEESAADDADDDDEESGDEDDTTPAAFAAENVA